MMATRQVLVAGGDEFGSAIAAYLRKAGIAVVLSEQAEKRDLRRNICFSEALFSGTQVVDDVPALLIDENILMNFEAAALDERWNKAVNFYVQDRQIPMFTEKEFPHFIDTLQPEVIIRTDINPFFDITLQSAPLIIGLHPCHKLNETCHIAIESRQNYNIGQVYTSDPEPSPDFDRHFFKQPFEKIHAPLEGVFVSDKNIGDNISRNQAIGKIDDIEIRSPYDGQIWGLSHSGKIIRSGEAMALIFEGPSSDGFKRFDFRHKTVAGAALKEVLHFFQG